MHRSKEHLRTLGRLTAWVAAHTRIALGGALLVTALSVVLAVTGLEFKSDRSDLISPEADFHRRWLEYCERFRETSDLLILLESPAEEPLRSARDWLRQELVARRQLFAETMIHSSLAEWQNLSASSFPARMLELEEEYRLARTIQESANQGTPLETLVAAAHEEVLNRQSGESLPVDVGHGHIPSIDLTARLTQSLEQSLAKLDETFIRYFAGKPAESEAFWGSFGAPHTSTAYVRENDPTTAGRRPEDFSPSARPLQRMANGLYHELVSVVPIVQAETTGEKYLPNIVALGELVQAARQRFPAVTFGVTGIPQLEHEEMARSQTDMLTSSLVSLTGVVLLLIFGFRGILLPIACCITLGCGMLWTLGFTTLAIGHLNILSMAFAAILVGLGIDFGIHLLSSFQDFRHQGYSVRIALARGSDTVGKGIVTAAVTTAVAFLCAGLTDFPGVAELGIIAGGGVLLAAAATFLVFPAIVVLMGSAADREVLAQRRDPARERSYSFGLRQIITARPLLVLTVLAGPLTALSWQAWDWDHEGWSCRVHYDANLLNMQPEHLPAVETQQKLQVGREGELLYAVTWYQSREQALQQAERFRQLPTVGRVDELASSQNRNEAALAPDAMQKLLDSADSLAAPPQNTLPHNPATIGKMLEQLLAALGQSTGVHETQLRLQLDYFLDTYSQQPFDRQIQLLDLVEKEILRALWSGIRMDVARLREQFEVHQNLGQIMNSRFTNALGDWLVQIHPRFDIWDDTGLAEFVSDLRTVDPHVTGTPIQNYEAGGQLKQSYLNAAAYAALAIVLVLLLDVTGMATIWRSWLFSLILTGTLLGLKGATTGLMELSGLQLTGAFVAGVVLFSVLLERRECLIGLLALVPPSMGALMLLGVMALLQLQFTPANLIALPLVMGIGIDDGIHVIHDFRRARLRYHMSGTTWRALVLTSLTSIIGFGSLAIASHRGLAGLGTVVVIGIASCLFCSVVLLPAILSLLAPGGSQIRLDAEPSEPAAVLLPFPASVDGSGQQPLRRRIV